MNDTYDADEDLTDDEIATAWDRGEPVTVSNLAESLFMPTGNAVAGISSYSVDLPQPQPFGSRYEKTESQTAGAGAGR